MAGIVKIVESKFMTNHSSHLLVVEDDRAVAAWLATLFRRFGFSVGVADDGLIGLSMARDRRTDVVVFDYHLPGLNGGEGRTAALPQRYA